MIFKNEYEYLVHLLSCAVNNTVPEDVPENISLEKVLEYGIEHEVANIAFLSIKKLNTPADTNIFNRFRQEYYKAVKRDAIQSKARSEILSALHLRGIYTLEMQGTIVKQYYPQSHLRMMSDLDFIIAEDKLSLAEKTMNELGYETEFTHDGVEIEATKDQVYVELHTDFFENEQSVYSVLNHPFDITVLNDDFTATVTDTSFYLFHLLHTIKHATEYMGIGIRRIIDLYYLEIALKDKADFLYIDRLLKEYGLYELKVNLLAVKDYWFCGAIANEKTLAFEKEIFESGNHGTDKIYYRNMYKLERAKGKHFLRLKHILFFLFPKKDDIYQSYPFCRKNHFPTVLCWIYRILSSLFDLDKWNNLKKTISIALLKFK